MNTFEDQSKLDFFMKARSTNSTHSDLFVDFDHCSLLTRSMGK